MRQHIRFSLVLAIALFCEGCYDVAGPSLLGQFESIPGIVVRLTVTPHLVQPGDTVLFVASAYNPTDHHVQIANSCGPVFDVIVLRPDGSETSVLSALLGPHGVFTCPGGERYVAEPGETEQERLRWHVDGTPGTYGSVAGLRWNSGLRNHGDTVYFTVR